jgi:phospholipase C
LVTAAANQLGSVEHIVVLVLENRSFDHMLGLAGVAVPTSTVPNPVAGTPSHIQQTYAQLVSALPVNDTQGVTHAAMPALATEQDYHDYITSRSAAWTAARASAPTS